MKNLLEIKKAHKIYGLLFLIVALSFALRIYNISYHDSYTDEVLYAFRAIGMIDYDTSPTQTTPWQWFEDVPWWARLSFHDHPPLFFLIEHLSMKLFGINLIAVRLPVVLFGVGSVILLFLLAKKMFNERVALFAALILGVSSYHVWVSRIGIQDGMVIFLILLIIWLWLKAIENKKYLLWCGVAIGVGILTKYTILIIFPILFLHALIFKIKAHKEKYFWAGLVAVLVVSAPVWLYNIFLYKTRGHFDFQISAALGQQVPEWSFRMGRELAGGVGRRFANFWLALRDGNSTIFNLLAAIAFLSGCWRAFKNNARQSLFLIGVLVLLFCWFMVIGSTYRFVVMIIPFIILLSADMFEDIIEHRKKIFFACLIMFVIVESAFSINSFLLQASFGKENTAYAKINSEEKNFGFNELDDYLDNLLKGQYTNFMGEPDYIFLQKLPVEYIDKMKRAGAKPASIIIVYDDNLNFLSTLWVLNRRLYYEGWPIMDRTTFEKITSDELDDFYRKIGVEKFVYIEKAFDSSQTNIKKRVQDVGTPGYLIKNGAGEPSFVVYEF